MEAPVHILQLTNGLVFRFLDRTRHYYGGFYHVKVHVCCELPVLPEQFASQDLHSQAVAILGNTVNYAKTLERMGVPESDIPDVRDKLISRFVESSFSYLSAPSFPSGVVRSELERHIKKNPGRPIRFTP